MTDLQQDSAIAKLEGNPSTELQTPRDRGVWSAFKKWVGRKFAVYDGVDEAFAKAKVAQQENNARKTAEEAAELAAKAEEAKAKARLTQMQADAQLLENFGKLADLDPVSRVIALAKLMEEDSRLIEQVEKIEAIKARLRLQHGTIIEFKGMTDEESN